MRFIKQLVKFSLMGFILSINAAYADNGCIQNDLGKVICASPGGTAVNSLGGVVCAPGKCATDNLGYLKCSSEVGGGATKDNLGRVVCVGGCIVPSKELCAIPK